MTQIKQIKTDKISEDQPNQSNLRSIPKHWSWVKLGDVCEITSSKRIFKDDYVEEGIPFYRTKEIVELSEGKEISIELYISQSLYNEIKSKFDVPKKDDLLVSAVGTIGVIYIVKNNNPFYFKDGNLLWIKNIHGSISRYLKYALNNFLISNIKVSGSAYNALTIIKLKDLSIPLPPLSEQKKIVEKIEELFS